MRGAGHHVSDRIHVVLVAGAESLEVGVDAIHALWVAKGAVSVPTVAATANTRLKREAIRIESSSRLRLLLMRDLSVNCFALLRSML